MKEPKHIELKGNCHYPVSSYIQSNLPIIMKMVEKLKPEIDDDSELILWCRGSSGAIIAAVMATMINNAKISHVKKEGEGSHSNIVSCHPEDKKKAVNVIVDDFMSSGETLNAIYEAMQVYKCKVHGLCISGSVYKSRLKFTPKFIVCGSVSE